MSGPRHRLRKAPFESHRPRVRLLLQQRAETLLSEPPAAVPHRTAADPDGIACQERFGGLITTLERVARLTKLQVSRPRRADHGVAKCS